MGKLYTGRIYDHKRIKKILPEAQLISVMRRRWQHAPVDIINLTELGPPIELFREARNAVKNGNDNLDFEIAYSARYMTYLLLGGHDECPDITVEKILRKLRNGNDVVLLCHEKAGEFCHRRILYHFMIHCLGEDYAGDEVVYE